MGRYDLTLSHRCKRRSDTGCRVDAEKAATCPRGEKPQEGNRPVLTSASDPSPGAVGDQPVPLSPNPVEACCGAERHSRHPQPGLGVSQSS